MDWMKVLEQNFCVRRHFNIELPGTNRNSMETVAIIQPPLRKVQLNYLHKKLVDLIHCIRSSSELLLTKVYYQNSVKIHRNLVIVSKSADTIVFGWLVVLPTNVPELPPRLHSCSPHNLRIPWVTLVFLQVSWSSTGECKHVILGQWMWWHKILNWRKYALIFQTTRGYICDEKLVLILYDCIELLLTW